MSDTVSTSTNLSRLISPRSIALVGASERPESIGGRVLANLSRHSKLRGPLYLVNPQRQQIHGEPCFARVADLPEAPDVVVVAVPAAGVREVILDCAQTGVPFAIVLSSGLAEAGPEGEALQAELAAIAQRSGLRIYGPNCPGLCNIEDQIGMTLSPSFPNDLRSGPVGLVTQGGGLGRTVMQAMDRGLGISVWASTGNELDLDTSDFIEDFASREGIDVIVTILEGIKDGPRFVRAVTKAAEAGKPVVALKIGRSEQGARAAESHTASMTGTAEVNSAVMRQFGVIEVDDIDELVDTASLLCRTRPDPADAVQRANAVAIYSSSGGTSALTADLVSDAGVDLCEFDRRTVDELATLLPDYAAMENPVDTTAVVLSDDDIFTKTLGSVCRDPNAAAVLLPIALDYGAITETMARNAVAVQQECAVPIVPIWPSDRLGAGYTAFAEAGMVPMRSIGKAAKAVRRYGEYVNWLAEWSPAETTSNPIAPSTAALPADEAGAKAWLRDAGVAVPAATLCTSPEQAIRAADSMGYPVVAKVSSPTVQHKSDIGGVVVDIRDALELRTAWTSIVDAAEAHKVEDADGILVEQMAPQGGVELLVGVTRDEVFGHVLTFGLGGIHVELLDDVARALLPLTPRTAHALIREIRGFPLLDGARGRPPADTDALADLLVRVSDLVTAQGNRIEELDLNPVWVGPVGAGAMVLDALVVGREDAGEA